MLLAQIPMSTCGRGGDIERKSTGMKPRDDSRIIPDIHSHRHRDVMSIAKDGNYHFTNGGKDADEKDVALTENAGSFVNQSDAAKILERAKQSKHVDVCDAVLCTTMLMTHRQQTTCSDFGAMKHGTYETKISGILAILCRHGLVLPGGVIDLHTREG